MIHDDFILSNLARPAALHRYMLDSLANLGLAADKDLTNVIDLAIERSAAHDNVGTIKAAEELQSMIRLRLQKQRH